MSSDEEDVHQCGRCKQIFTDIDAYFTHKKSKSCQKVSFSKPPSTATVEPEVEANETSTVRFLEAQTVPTAKGGNSMSHTQLYLKKAQLFGHGEKGDVCADSVSSVVADPQSSNLTALQVKKRRRSAPKKAWAEDYALENEGKEDDLFQEGQSMDEPAGFYILNDPQNNATCIKRKGRKRKKNIKNLATESKNKKVKSNYTIEEDIELDDVEDSNDFDETPVKTESPRNVPQKMNLRARSRRNKSLELQKCPMCSYQTLSIEDYNKHVKTKHSNHSFTCEKCDETFIDECIFSQHKKGNNCKNALHLIENPPNISGKGEEAGKPRKRVNKAIQNVDVSCQEKSADYKDYMKSVVTFNCWECDFSDAANYDCLMQHNLEVHPNISPAICPYCGLWFSTESLFTRHLLDEMHDYISMDERLNAIEKLKDKDIHWMSSKTLINYEPVRYMCTQCKKIIASKDHFKTHANEYHQIKKHGVEASNKSTKQVKRNTPEKDEKLTSPEGFVKNKSTIQPRKYTPRKELKVRKDPKLSNPEDLECKVCSKKFLQKCHIARHADSVHKPTQQLPNSLSPVYSFNDLDTTLGIKLEKHQCFVCCVTLTSRTELFKHMDLHKVWIPEPEKGSIPKDILAPFYSHACKTTVTKIMEAQASAWALKKTNNNDQGNLTSNNTSDENNEVCDSGLSKLMLDMFQEIANNDSNNPNIQTPVTKEGTSKNPLKEETNESHLLQVDSLSEESVGVTTKQIIKKDLVHVCVYCFKNTKTTEELYFHKVHEHQLVLKWCCNRFHTCNATFETVDEYKEHNEQVHDQRSWICSLCNEHYFSQACLLVHKSCSHKMLHQYLINIHNKYKTNFDNANSENENAKNTYKKTCKNCGKVSKTKQEHQEHLEYFCSPQNHLCELCGQVFKNKIVLNRHRLTHDPAHLIICKLCDRQFNKKEHLRRHMISKHSEETPYVCEFEGCKKSFKRRDKLQDHQRVHSDNKPYPCGICGRRYRYKEGLNYHIKTHNRGDKTFKCSICKVPFPRPGMLKLHMEEVHKIEMKKDHIYHCDKCDSTFSRPERFKRHIEREHKDNQNWAITCGLCNKGFPGKKSYESHVKQKHSKVNPLHLKTSTGEKSINLNEENKVTDADNQAVAFCQQENGDQQGYSLQHLDSGIFLITPEGNKVPLKPVEGHASLDSSQHLQIQTVHIQDAEQTSNNEVYLESTAGGVSIIEGYGQTDTPAEEIASIPAESTLTYDFDSASCIVGSATPKQTKESADHPAISTSLNDDNISHEDESHQHTSAHQPQNLQMQHDPKDQNLSLEIQMELQKHLQRHMQDSLNETNQSVQQIPEKSSSLVPNSHEQSQNSIVSSTGNTIASSVIITNSMASSSAFVTSPNTWTNALTTSGIQLTSVQASPQKLSVQPSQHILQSFGAPVYQPQIVSPETTPTKLQAIAAANQCQQNITLPGSLVQQGNVMIPVQYASINQAISQLQAPKTNKEIPITPKPQDSTQLVNAVPQLVQISYPLTFQGSNPVLIPSLSMQGNTFTFTPSSQAINTGTPLNFNGKFAIPVSNISGLLSQNVANFSSPVILNVDNLGHATSVQHGNMQQTPLIIGQQGSGEIPVITNTIGQPVQIAMNPSASQNQITGT